MTDYQKLINEAEEELKVLRRAQQAADNEAREAVVPVYQYTLLPHESTFDRIYDNTVLTYRLEGKALNAEEMLAVGARPFEGGMTYVFNTLSGRLVMSVSGGKVYVNTIEAFNALSQFLVENPEGGDVTDIVKANPSKRF